MHSGFNISLPEKAWSENRKNLDYSGSGRRTTLSIASLSIGSVQTFLKKRPQLNPMPESYTAKQSYYFKAKPEKVFEALTEPKGLVKWFLSKAKIETKTGGAFSFNWTGGYCMNSSVKKFEKNRAVSFSWKDQLNNGEIAKTIASFELVKKGKGTLLKLHHTGLKDPEHFADCSSRWAYYLTNMKSVVDHGRDLRSRYDW